MSNPVTDWSVPQRQSGSALLIIVFKTIIEVLKGVWPLLIAIFFTGKGKSSDKIELLLIAFSFLVLLRSLIEFFFFHFQIINMELIIRKGLVSKKTITLPVERIITVHIDQTWLHKIFNVAQVSFDSSGTEKTEVVIKAIPLQKAESLRQFITDSKPENSIVQENTPINNGFQPLISLSGRDLLKLCISANHIEALFVLFAFILSVVDNISQATGKEASCLLAWIFERIDTRTLSGILFLFVSVLLFSIVISSARILLRYSNFSILGSDKGFRVYNGLINSKEKLVPFRKIQHLSWKANWLQKKMDINLLQFHVAGSGQPTGKMEVKIPVTRNEFIYALLKEYHEPLPINELKAIKIHKAYINRRILLIGLPVSFLSFIIAWFNIHWYALLFFLFAFYIAFSAWQFQKNFCLWAGNDAMQIKKGILGTEEIIMKWHKIQSVQLNQSIYQRQKKVATLKMFTAGGSIIIPLIQEREAFSIYNYILYKTESENQAWM